MIDKITLPEDNYNVPDYDEKLANKTNEIVDEVNEHDTRLGTLETTVTEHGNKITQLLAWMGLVKDYVIETGENANGKWEKWHSGKLVQHVTADLGNIEFDTLTSGTYPAKTYPWLDLPIPFINNEYTCMPPNFYGAGFLGIAIHTKTSSTFRVKLWSWGQTPFNVVADFIFEGRWK